MKGGRGHGEGEVEERRKGVSSAGRKSRWHDASGVMWAAYAGIKNQGRHGWSTWYGMADQKRDEGEERGGRERDRPSFLAMYNSVAEEQSKPHPFMSRKKVKRHKCGRIGATGQRWLFE